MKVSKLKLNPDNPRVIKDDKFTKLCQSITEFPKMMEIRPMVVDNDYMVLGGNQRLKAIKELGMKEVPDTWVKQFKDLTDEEKKEFIIKDNIGYGSWEYNDLSENWEQTDLEHWGVDLPEWDDYSEKNKEIDVNDFDNEMVINLKYNESDYFKVKDQLSKIAATPEQAVWILLGNES